MLHRLLWLIVLLACLSPAQNSENTLTETEIADGWLLLFDGFTLYGWTPGGNADWKAADGAILAESGESGWLLTNSVFADYILKCDFRTIENGNSGIFLRSAKEGKPWESGYELQIWNAHPKFPTGGLVNTAAAETKFETKPGTWHRYEVAFAGDRFTIKLDGITLLQGRDQKSRSGHIGLQYNKNHRIEFRNIKLRPMGSKALFDGQSLRGWNEVKRPDTKEPPVWSVRDRMIHVEKGPGQLETDSQFKNFLLQLDIRANAQHAEHHPNSGVFLRGTPGGFWTGYEAQIRNEYKDGDPSRPVDFGTGGIYFHVPARRVVSRDNQFFPMSIQAFNRHIAIWVNGFPVADWEDPHPEGASVRDKQAILGAGTISLQAHDPTTNLDFKNLRMIVLPE